MAKLAKPLPLMYNKAGTRSVFLPDIIRFETVLNPDTRFSVRGILKDLSIFVFCTFTYFDDADKFKERLSKRRWYTRYPQNCV